MPILSIISINFNNKKGLEKTISSVIHQNFTDIEYIVIDGGSEDGSDLIINDNADVINYWVSEPDKGIYNAMNKGLARATGKYVLFLNSGDYFNCPSSLNELISASEDTDLVYGDMIFKSEASEFSFNYPDKLDFDFFVNNSIPHPATIIKRELFVKYGNYDEQFVICSDWVFFIDLIIKHNASYKRVPSPITVFMKGGLSSDHEKVMAEKERHLLKEHRFIYQQYLALSALRKKINTLRKSRVIRCVFFFLPKRYKSVLS